MERISERTSGLDELGGFVKLGMKREALKLARRTLKQADVTAKAFNDALDAVLTLADDPVAGFSKRRRTILLLLGEKAGMREDVKHFLPRGCVKGPPSFSLIF